MNGGTIFIRAFDRRHPVIIKLSDVEQRAGALFGVIQTSRCDAWLLWNASTFIYTPSESVST